jgi:hypothetical protein
MIRRFSNKLRIAGLEDSLRHEMCLKASTAKWLAYLAYETAEKQGIDLLSLKGRIQLNLLFSLMRENGFDTLLDILCADQPEFAQRLAQMTKASSGQIDKAA